MVSNRGWYGVDLDGTLAHHESGGNIMVIGKPIPAMVQRVKNSLALGHDVRIVTARVDGGLVALAVGDMLGEQFRDIARMVQLIEAWCLEHLGQVLPVTNKKDYCMLVLWDDRAVQVVRNTGEVVGGCPGHDHL